MGKASSGELLQGTLPLIILRILNAGPNHGFAIARRIELISKDVIRAEEGSLYPALHRLEEKGWLDAEWGHTDRGRRAKFYRLTAAGRRQLTAELSKWAHYTEAVGLVIAAKGARS